MNKKDLDALASLYEGVYSPTNNGEYLTEDIKSFSDRGGALGALGRAISRSGTDAGKAQNRAALSRANQGIASFMNRGGVFGRGGAVDRLANKPAKPTQTSALAGRVSSTNDIQSLRAGQEQARKDQLAKASKTQPTGSNPPANPGGNQPPKPATAKVAPTAAKPAGQTGDKAKDMATWAKANPTLANKPKTPNPLMQKTFGYQTGNAPDQVAKTAAATAAAGKNLTGTGALAPKPTPSTTPIKKPGAVMSSFEWGSKATLKDIANAYNAVYEAKKKDQDQDGDNDFADVRIARMIASGMSKAEAIAAVRNKEYNEEFESWVDSLVEEGYDLSDYTMDEMFDIYLDEAEGSYGATPKAYSAASKTKMTAKRKPFLKKMLSRTNPANRTDPYGSPRKGMTADDRESARAGSKHGVGTRQEHDYPSEGPGGVTKSAKKLRKQKAMGEFGEAYEIDEATLSAKAARAGKDIGAKGKNFAKIAASAGERYGSAEAGKRVAGAILKKMRANEEFELDEATRMRKELGKEGETAVRKELAARSKAYKRSGSVDKTIAAAERAADWSGNEKNAKVLRGLAASRRGSVRDKPRAGMRGYAAKVEGGDRDLQSARQRAMSAGTLTPKEKKQLGEEYAVYEIVASYLLENNFAETLNDANVIIENMSEVWLDQILEAKKSLPVAKMKRKESKLLDNEEGQLQALRTNVGSKERKERMKELQRFDNINSVRTSVAKRGGKQQHSMPEIGRYKPKDED